jgi:hypothetical protein
MTVVSPIVVSILASTARTPGHAVTAAEQPKTSLYTSVCAAVDIPFVPFAQETFGGSSGMASHQISLIADRQADRTGSPHGCPGTPCSVRFFAATERSIARDISDWASQIPEYAPLFPPCVS